MASAAELWGAVPTIDFSAFAPGAPRSPAQLATARRIEEVCRVHGFLKLHNVGISAADMEAAFAAAKTLFALPEQHKTAGGLAYTPS
jgi:isopenicillin N synthase-like dioxygenase